MTSAQIIYQNFVVSLADLAGFLLLGFLSYYINPMRILKVKTIIFCAIILFLPYLLNNVSTTSHVLYLQMLVIFFGLSTNPAAAIFFKHFPVFKRFTYTGMAFSAARALMYTVTSFGVVYLSEYFGNYGLLVLFIPVIIGFAYGLYHFDKLEKGYLDLSKMEDPAVYVKNAVA